MGKAAIRLKEVVYTLNNYNQSVMQGLWKDAGYKMTKKIKENGVEWFGFFLFPTIGTYMYANNYKHNEKLHHRY